MITLRRIYLITSLLWAMVLGPAIALGVFVLGAGISWLYLFGDDPWPRAVEWILPLIALIAGSITALAVVWFGCSRGRRFPTSGASTDYPERRKAILLGVVPIVLFLVIALSIWTRISAYQEAMTIATAREARFADLANGNQRIGSLSVEYDNDDDLRAVARITGSRDGRYRLAWRVSPSSFETAIITASRELVLSGGPSQAEIRFSLGELRSGYQAEILNGGTGVLVEELFEIDASLEPVLSAEEILDFPPGEQRRLGTEESSLSSSASANFPVSFSIP